MAPPVIGAILAVTALGGLGLSVAGAAGAFAPDTPDIPGRDDPLVEANRKRRVAQRLAQQGRASTILAPTSTESTLAASRPLLLGGGAPGGPQPGSPL